MRPRDTHLGPAALFGVLAVLAVVDLAGDLAHGPPGPHEAVELTIGLLSAAGGAWLAARWGQARRAAQAAESALADTTLDARRWRDEAARWRSEADHHVRGVGAAIDAQFDVWGLTPAEREVALLLLKGLSSHEIAAVRDASERTVREQAGAVYRKAGLGGRAELAAFFLEDLLAPQR